jgi:hypothetical protein
VGLNTELSNSFKRSEFNAEITDFRSFDMDLEQIKILLAISMTKPFE